MVVQPLSTQLGSEEPLWSHLQTIRVRKDCIDTKPDPPYEMLCMSLESSFHAEGMVCSCCQRDTPQRCPWCIHAVGWHRCMHRMQEKGLAYADPEAYVWKRSTLYHEMHDAQVAVLSMVRQGVDKSRIQQLIADLCKDDIIDRERDILATPRAIVVRRTS